MYGLPKGGDVGHEMNNNLNCIHLYMLTKQNRGRLFFNVKWNGRKK